jgi:hypothetical protein
MRCEWPEYTRRLHSIFRAIVDGFISSPTARTKQKNFILWPKRPE